MAKTLQLISPGGVTVNYLTDLIGDNQELTIYQILESGQTGAGSVVLSDAAKSLAIPQKIDEFNLIGDFKKFASDNEYALNIYENGKAVINEVESVATDILVYSFPEQAATATIDSDAHTVDIGVTGVDDLTALTAEFTTSYNSEVDIADTDQVSGTTENDFSSEVTYTVTAEDGSTEQDWAINVVSIDTDVVSYSFAAQTGAATIDSILHTIDIEVANGTDVSALVATFGLSYGAAADISDVAQVSTTTPNNFSAPVVYTITADDESTEQDWTITVTVAA